jgi:menaquinone-dependent protoporphyrinogen oxidase
MKTIIIYSTKYGSVGKAAIKLKAHLKGEAVIADVKSKPDYSGFETVILGGSIYAGSVQKEMKQFLKHNLSELGKKRIGLFVCAGTDKKESIDSYLRKNFTPELYERAVVKANLGYEYDLQKFSFLDRLIVRIVGVKKSASVFFEDKIKEFADKLNNS